MVLKIISPQALQTFDILWLEVDTPTGNFVIQPGHAPTILILERERPIRFLLDNGRQGSVVIKEGVVEITRTAATVVANI